MGGRGICSSWSQTLGQRTPEFVALACIPATSQLTDHPRCHPALSPFFHLPAEAGSPGMAVEHSDYIQVQEERIWLVGWEGSGSTWHTEPRAKVQELLAGNGNMGDLAMGWGTL